MLEHKIELEESILVSRRHITSIECLLINSRIGPENISKCEPGMPLQLSDEITKGPSPAQSEEYPGPARIGDSPVE